MKGWAQVPVDHAARWPDARRSGVALLARRPRQETAASGMGKVSGGAFATRVRGGLLLDVFAG